MDAIKEIKELTKKRKLIILNQILQEYPDGYRWLFLAIACRAYEEGFISYYQCNDFSVTEIATSLMPELNRLEPKDDEDNWLKISADRIEAIKEMIK